MTASQMIEVLKQLDGNTHLSVMTPKGGLYPITGVYETHRHTTSGVVNTIALSFSPSDDNGQPNVIFNPVYIPQKKQPL